MAQRTKPQVKPIKWSTVKSVLNSTKRREGDEHKSNAVTQLFFGLSNPEKLWCVQPWSCLKLACGKLCITDRSVLFKAGVWAGDLQRTFPSLKYLMILVNYCFVWQWWICVTLGRSWSFSAPVLISLTALTALLCTGGAKYCKVHTQLFLRTVWGGSSYMRTCVNIWFLRGEILKGKGETACYIFRTQEAETNRDPLENKIQLKERHKFLREIKCGVGETPIFRSVPFLLSQAQSLTL